MNSTPVLPGLLTMMEPGTYMLTSCSRILR